MAKKYTNRNDNPLHSLKELSNELDWEKYEHKDRFDYLCVLEADKQNERLCIINPVEKHIDESCVYIMVVGGKIFKDETEGYRSCSGSIAQCRKTAEG